MAAEPQRRARRRLTPEALRRLLERSDGLEAAIVLSEVLAPPLALRDNPGFERWRIPGIL